MTGDGLNDARAFKQSDVALSIADDIYHFSHTGNAIIDASKFYALNKYLCFARRSLRIVKLSFLISLLYKICWVWILLLLVTFLHLPQNL
jgi:Cu+-exporting ATPase